MNDIPRELQGLSDPAFQELANASLIVAATDVRILLYGEAGTGKAAMAQAIHRVSRRSAGPFVAVNCVSISGDLAESRVFGGSVESRGFLRAAEGGTLFLEEVDALSLQMQAKLLGFLESGCFLPVNGLEPVDADVRVIAATSQDLERMVREGTFRRDLQMSLGVVPLKLPSLRERRADILPLLDRFVAEAAAEHGLPRPTFSRDTRRRLKSYDWPGNLTELRNLAERLTILVGGREVSPTNLPAELRGTHAPGTSHGFVLPGEGVILDEVEAGLIRQALERTGGNRSRAARLLGLSRDTFLYRMKKYAIH